MRNYHYAKAGEVMYHTGLTKEHLAGARYAVVPGDPGRVPGLAKALDPSAVFLKIPGIPRAVLQAVHGAVAEQAVEVCKSLVAGEIFTIFILKKTIGIFHLQHSHPSITCKVCALAQICV